MQDGKSYVQKDIAQSIALEPTRVSKWNRSDDFRLAVAEIIKAGHAVLIEVAHASLLKAAARGNLPAYNAVMDRLERHGRIKTIELSMDGTGAIDPAAAGGGTHIHIHGIPERQPMSALPPVLALPASSAQTVSSTTPK